MKKFRKEQYETGYKKYEGKAKRYVENPEEMNSLLKKALHKADYKKKSLDEVWDKLQLLFELVKAWSKKDYQDISKKTILMVIATIIYFVSPVDLIPDFLVGLGIFDDVAVIGFTVRQISSELERFKAWKEKESVDMIE
ncbi:DUF1232 domain-containing protein [Bacillus sp. V3B]|uniref:YkvA family protein n=1 Tax=Bacillus sp. V3B TaxID=2804915 RepID=UPI0021087710|nr:YkvA family protein [Bacillus sp. V3B]MCQ6275058.1 DUF1232 domain-containing protein [Bacillus sp. V3B]